MAIYRLAYEAGGLRLRCQSCTRRSFCRWVLDGFICPSPPQMVLLGTVGVIKCICKQRSFWRVTPNGTIVAVEGSSVSKEESRMCLTAITVT